MHCHWYKRLSGAVCGMPPCPCSRLHLPCGRCSYWSACLLSPPLPAWPCSKRLDKPWVPSNLLSKLTTMDRNSSESIFAKVPALQSSARGGCACVL